MAVNPDDFLVSAEKVTIDGIEEMTRRSSIHLSYYAAHHVAKTVLPSGITEDTGRSSHQAVIDGLFLSGDRGLVAAGHALNHARGLRHRADYKLDDEVNEFDANMAINSSKNVFDKVQRFADEKAS